MMYADTALGRAEASPGLAGHLPVMRPSLPPEVREDQRLALGSPRPRRLRPVVRADDRMAPGLAARRPAGAPRGGDGPAPGRHRDRLGRRGRDPALADLCRHDHRAGKFYGERMAWIFDATRVAITVRPSGAAGKGAVPLEISPLVRRGMPQAHASRPRGRQCLACAALGVSHRGPGVLYTRASIEGWLRDGTGWERCRGGTASPSRPAVDEGGEHERHEDRGGGHDGQDEDREAGPGLGADSAGAPR